MCFVFTHACFADPSGEFCPEKKVLYNLISGLHTSISVHIAADYLLDETANLVSFCSLVFSLLKEQKTEDVDIPQACHSYWELNNCLIFMYCGLLSVGSKSRAVI